jgi:heme oxygenase
LRQATEEVHQRLHEAAPFAAIARQELAKDAYADLLRKIAAFHFAVSPALDLDGARPRLLARDLQALGAPAPLPADWHAPQGENARLGCAYVVQGSGLGGKVIYRQLDYLFGASAEGRRFFAGYPTDGARWRSLCDRIERAGEELEALDSMIAGALQAFSFFERLVAPRVAHA